jgi:hypothetical protein
MKRVNSVTKLNAPNLPFLHALRTWKARFFIEDPYIFSNNIGGRIPIYYIWNVERSSTKGFPRASQVRLQGRGEESTTTKLVASKEITNKNKGSCASAAIIGSSFGICRTKRPCRRLFVSKFLYKRVFGGRRSEHCAPSRCAKG